jgi:hypothetical protein
MQKGSKSDEKRLQVRSHMESQQEKEISTVWVMMGHASAKQLLPHALMRVL